MEWIKNLHVFCAVLTIIGFFSRGLLRLLYPTALSNKLIKITPHIVDTVLLLSAIALASQWMHSIQYWLIVKIVALIFYILLGHKALDRNLAKPQSAMAFGAALFVFSFIFSVAVTKSTLGFFIYLV